MGLNSAWVHYKGGTYTMIGESIHTETGEELVVYKDSEGKIWARPYDMFYGRVDVEGQRVWRFTLVKDKEIKS